MDDFNSRNNLDYQSNPLDAKNLTGVHWNEAMRKVEPPPLFNNTENYNESKSESHNSFAFIAFLFFGFLCLMAFMWVCELLYGFFN